MKIELPDDLIASFNGGDPIGFSAVRQIHTYMVTLKIKFGVLSSYRKTFFCSISEDGSFLVSRLISQSELLPYIMDFLSIPSLWDDWKNIPATELVYSDDHGGDNVSDGDDNHDDDEDYDPGSGGQSVKRKTKTYNFLKRLSGEPCGSLLLVVNPIRDCVGVGAVCDCPPTLQSSWGGHQGGRKLSRRTARSRGGRS